MLSDLKFFKSIFIILFVSTCFFSACKKDSDLELSNTTTETVQEDKGYLAYDSTNDRLYISTPSAVLRIDDASNSTATTNLSVPTTVPEAIALDPSGRLLVFAEPVNVNNSDTALYRNENPETNQNSWIDIADNTLKRVVPPVTDIDASTEYIVLVTAGKGMLVSENDTP